MRRSDDAESRSAGGRAQSPVEEVLEVGHRRLRLPRWFWTAAIGTAAVVVVSVAVATSRSHHHGHPTHLLAPLPVVHVHSPMPVVSRGAVLDAVAFGQHTWVLYPDRILGRSTTAVHDRTVRLPRLRPRGLDGSWRLVLDAKTARLWAVLEGTRYGRAVEYRLWTLTRVRDLRLPPINRAGAMDGHLYLTSERELLDVAPNSALRVVPVPDVSGALGPITADPARSRLLVLNYGSPTHIWIYEPRRHEIRPAAVLPFTKPSIAITRAAIWVGGFTESTAVLWRLDAGSLARRGGSPITGHLGPGALLLAGGTRDLWVASGGGPGLWCVDARTGAGRQHWALAPTAVTTDRGRVIAVTGGHILPLNLRGGCTD